MRIAVVCTDTGVRIPDTKGASLHLSAITLALARAGHDVLLVAIAGHGTPPAGVQTLLVPHPGWSRGLRREAGKLRTIRRVVRDAGPRVARFRPDVVYERLSLFGNAGRELALAAKAHHVVEVNALIADEEARWRELRLSPLAERRQRATLRGADLRVAVSEELAAKIRRITPGAPTAVLPNGVDADAFARMPSRSVARRFLHLPTDAHVLGFAGTLRPWHGLETAIDALTSLPDAMLAVAGEGDLRAELDRRAKGLGVATRVRWMGALPHELMPGFLAALDVALLPYPALDGFAFSPLKMYEYLAAGVPIVASDIGQIRGALGGGRWGRLVRPEDPGALAGAVRDVLSDPAGSRKRARAARRIALGSHSWDHRARTLTTLLSEVHADALAG